MNQHCYPKHEFKDYHVEGNIIVVVVSIHKTFIACINRPQSKYLIIISLTLLVSRFGFEKEKEKEEAWNPFDNKQWISVRLQLKCGKRERERTQAATE